MTVFDRSRPLHRLAILATSLVLALPATTALAQSPFGNLPQGTPSAPTQTATQIGGTTNDDGLDTWQTVLIAGAAIALLVGVFVVIVRDAHRRAPVHAADSESAHLPADAHKGSQAAKRKQRKKDKAARQQRRRNR